ncbi:Lrp/AsnC family transcriptional regulator [Tardiphaga alba]|uniref:Lrp/AsnC family transcriptional regulator n=1 Tax=Tardiphaga alba TaxID=340268 RepID=A0ABX8AJA6_9BRAD|nr:Lrp/AsnC family transcriptional regulator [Tardiphaga alba]QUS42435.1 Lrp/AsnC family transcriptional regulator [Tardiphaga alba]
MDRFDREILAHLQEDSTVSVAELAERVGLTSTPCWRRIQRLEERGVIKKRVTLLEPKQINLSFTVFISIRTREHRFDWFENFHKLVSEIPEVTEFHRVAGSTDYLLKVVVSDMDGYDHIYKTLIKGADLADVTSMFVIEEIKHTTSLPLTHA